MKHTLYKEADYKTSEHMGGTARGAGSISRHGRIS